MKVKIFDNIDTPYADKVIPCTDACFLNNYTMLEILYHNGNTTYFPVNGIGRIEFIRSEDNKSCPTCFRLMEDNNDKK